MIASNVAATLAALFATVPVVAQSPALQPISFKAASGEVVAAERGSFEVPEVRGDPKSRRIRLEFVRFKSTNPRPGPPIVYVAGGPGGTGTDAARGPRFPLFMALRQVADVIAFDQRGTGINRPAPACRPSGAPDPAQPMTRINFVTYYRAAYAECWQRWTAAGADMRGYTTRESAADLDALRRTLDVPKLSLWGISYGTHLALAVMKYYPAMVHRVALASAEGLDQTVKSPAQVDRALARAGSAIGVPDLLDRMRRVHARVDASPVRLTVHDGKSFTIAAFPIQLMAQSMVKNPADLPRLVAFYRGLEAGAFDQLAPAIHGAFWTRPLVLEPMPVAMDLASGASAVRRARVERERGHAALGDALNFPLPAALGAVPGQDLGDAFRRPFRSNIPTLLISGTLDVRTPLEEQREAVVGLTQLTQITVENAGHDVLEAHPGVASALVAFFKDAPVGPLVLDLPPPKLP